MCSLGDSPARDFVFKLTKFCYNLKENLNRDYIEMKIPFQLIGKKIEISFRPDPYVTRKEIKLRNIWQRQSIPILRGKIDEVIKFI